MNANYNRQLTLACTVGLLGLTMVPALAQTPTLLYRGAAWKSLAHPTSGSVAVYKTADGKLVLRLTKLKTTKGPNTRVYLVEGRDAAKDDIIKAGKIVDLGELKGDNGNQTYDIPDGTDLNKYRSVSIWCARFTVNFAATNLNPVKK
jgi:hypothetical protein